MSDTPTVGTRAAAQYMLERGHTLGHAAWTFTKDSWQCGGGCCYDDGLEVEEVLDVLENFCGNQYEDVKVIT